MIDRLPTGPAVRRGAALVAATTVLTTVLLGAGVALAGPASAAVPEGWPDVPAIDSLYVLGVLVGIPLLLFAVITVAVYAPDVARGERVAPGATGPEDQWLGGRRTAGEISFTSTDTSTGSDATGATGAVEAGSTDGGASGRW